MAACGVGVRRAVCGVRRATAVCGGGMRQRRAAARAAAVCSGVRLTEETGSRQ
jgi:hypothetical protein